METVSKQEFMRLAELSNLSFSDEEYESFKGSFENMIAFTKEVSTESGQDMTAFSEYAHLDPGDGVKRPGSEAEKTSGFNTDENGFYRIKRIIG